MDGGGRGTPPGLEVSRSARPRANVSWPRSLALHHAPGRVPVVEVADDGRLGGTGFGRQGEGDPHQRRLGGFYGSADACRRTLAMGYEGVVRRRLGCRRDPRRGGGAREIRHGSSLPRALGGQPPQRNLASHQVIAVTTATMDTAPAIERVHGLGPYAHGYRPLAHPVALPPVPR
jgi:hypothetical protein